MPLFNRPLEDRPRWQRKMLVFSAGLRHAILNDFNVLYKTILSIVALGISAYLFRWVDFAIILVATGQVIASELFNSAIEEVCDFIQPRRDEQIKIIKDVAAAAASITMLVWVVVMGLQLFQAAQYIYRLGWPG